MEGAGGSAGREFAEGCKLQIKTTLGEDIEGHVLTYDKALNIVVLHILFPFDLGPNSALRNCAANSFPVHIKVSGRGRVWGGIRGLSCGGDGESSELIICSPCIFERVFLVLVVFFSVAFGVFNLWASHGMEIHHGWRFDFGSAVGYRPASGKNYDFRVYRA